MKLTTLLLATTLVLPTGAVFAQKPADDHSAHHPGTQAQSAAMSDGEVRKVDKGAKKITIKHGPLTNLEMPAMTMVFQVKDPAMLEQVKAGDKVKFRAEKIGAAYIIVNLEPAK